MVPTSLEIRFSRLPDRSLAGTSRFRFEEELPGFRIALWIGKPARRSERQGSAADLAVATRRLQSFTVASEVSKIEVHRRL